MKLDSTYDTSEVLFKIHCFARDGDIEGLAILEQIVHEEIERYSPVAKQSITMVFDATWDIMINGGE